ncbi:hypothetical protein QUF64_01555 [Anaerolineales bacterium HSG6]|nr:hypothetical protein [Anaerolineales bacterium HSG6]
MYTPNESHLQAGMFSDVKLLPERLQKELESSWAGTFYREVFCRIPERLFEPLYSDSPSRPNIPVNVLAGLQYLKAGFGWSDAEMYDNFCYNMQVRYAVGYRVFGAGHFALRSYYNFTRRIVLHCEETGEHLLLKAFETITDAQLSALKIFSSHQRMDSSQISSNIRSYSRLQLLVEIVQRQHRSLSSADQEAYAELLSPYLKDSSGQYIYRLKGNHSEHIEGIGQVMHKLVTELKAQYSDDKAYQQLVRVFNEHFIVEPTLRAKQGSELQTDSLQSPDDPEATFRHKAGEDYTGYVVNITETCHEDNPHQLIVGVQVEANNTDDAAMLAEALPGLKERTDLEHMTTDGTYGSEKVDQVLREEGVVLTQTAIRGRQPDPNKFNLANCEIELDPDTQEPLTVTAPNGQTATVEPGRKPGRFIARWNETQQEQPAPTDDHTAQLPSDDQHISDNLDTPILKPDNQDTVLPLPDQETEQPLFDHSSERLVDDPKPETENTDQTALPPPVFYFSQRNIEIAFRRQRLKEFYQTEGNPRAAVESTICAVKRPFADDTVPVRGKTRITMMLLGSAIMVNLRRIDRGMANEGNNSKQGKNFNPSNPLINLVSTFFAWFVKSLLPLLPTTKRKSHPIFS